MTHRHHRRGPYESAPSDRLVASVELDRTHALVARLLDLALATPRRPVLDLLCVAIEQAHAAVEHYRDLHRPARPYATDDQIDELDAARLREKTIAA